MNMIFDCLVDLLPFTYIFKKEELALLHRN